MTGALANFVEPLHWVPGIYPVANFMAGTVYTDIMECRGDGILYQITKGVGTTGTSTITVEACDTIVPANSTAVAFLYRTSTTPDTWSDWTTATTAGFTTTAGSNQMYQVFVPAAELGTEGYGYARLKAVEVVAAAVVGCINMAVVNSRTQPSSESYID